MLVLRIEANACISLVYSGHVTLQFKDRVYLIGGRSAEIQTYNLEETERNADVWYTNDGGETASQPGRHQGQ